MNLYADGSNTHDTTSSNKELPIAHGLKQLGFKASVSNVNLVRSPTAPLFNEPPLHHGSQQHSASIQTQLESQGNKSLILTAQDIQSNNVEELGCFIANIQQKSGQDPNTFIAKLRATIERHSIGTLSTNAPYHAGFSEKSEWRDPTASRIGKDNVTNGQRSNVVHTGLPMSLTAMTPATTSIRRTDGTEQTIGMQLTSNAAEMETFDVTESIKKIVNNDDIDNRKSTLVLLIPGKPQLLGYLMGQDGSEIARLEAATGSRIFIDKKTVHTSEDRQVYVLGTVLSNTKTHLLIASKLQEKLQYEPMNNGDRLIQVVPDEIVRHLIGKGGSNINKLQNDTGVRVKVESEAAMLVPGTLGRRIIIHGSVFSRVRAQYLICRQIVEDRNVPENWAGALLDPMVPGDFADCNAFAVDSESTGKFEENSMRFGASNSPQAHLRSHSSSSLSTSPNYNSLAGRGSSALGNLEPNTNQSGARVLHPPPPTPAEELPQPDLAIMDLGGHLIEGTSNEYSYGILVPNKAVAYLIGRGGVVITGVQHQSGAKIKIAKSSEIKPGATRRRVTLCGTQEAVQAARSIIERKLQSYDEFRGKGSSVNNQPRPSKPLRKRGETPRRAVKGNFTPSDSIEGLSHQNGSQLHSGPHSEMWSRGANSLKPQMHDASSLQPAPSSRLNTGVGNSPFGSFGEGSRGELSSSIPSQFSLGTLGHRGMDQTLFQNGQLGHRPINFHDRALGNALQPGQQQPLHNQADHGANEYQPFEIGGRPSPGAMPELFHGLTPMMGGQDGLGYPNSAGSQPYQRPIGLPSAPSPQPGYHQDEFYRNPS